MSNNKEVVLCVSNAYQKKFYLNENFNALPQGIKDELKIMCVLYIEDYRLLFSIFVCGLIIKFF